jgi:hypothetical protein
MCERVQFSLREVILACGFGALITVVAFGLAQISQSVHRMAGG